MTTTFTDPEVVESVGVTTVMLVFETLEMVAETPPIVTVREDEVAVGKFSPVITNVEPPKE